jgi:hypothetical protein
MIQDNQQSYDSSGTWSQFMNDFQNAQEFLLKDTLKNYYESRGLTQQANTIQVDSVLDYNDEKIISLLGLKTLREDNEKLHDLIDQKVASLAKKLSDENYDNSQLKALEKTVDLKLVHLHQVIKNDMLLKETAQPKIGVEKDEVIRLIKEARVLFKEDSRKMITACFPNGYDTDLQDIIQKKGNLTITEILKSRAAILKYSSQVVTSTLTQILNYGGDQDQLSLESESEFLKFFLIPLSTQSPDGRYGHNIIMTGIQTAWSELMSYLISPGNLSSIIIILKCRTMFYGCEDIGGTNFAFTEKLKNLCLEVSVANSEQIKNLPVVIELQQLVPKYMSEYWSYKPISNPNYAGKTVKQWGSLRLGRQMNKCYVDVGLENDLLSTYKSRQCFPLPYGGESPKNIQNQIEKNPEDGVSGFFTPNLKQFY